MCAPVWIFLINVAGTLCLTGLIWAVQLVHYPAFSFICDSRFSAFERFHQRRISWIVVPLMCAELLSSVLLVWWRPSFVPGWCVALGLAAVGVIWISTFALQVPLHARLTKAKDEETICRLVRTNGIRTVAWTARSGVLVWILSRGLGNAL